MRDIAKPSKEEKVMLKYLKKAEKTKDKLESILYDTFIMVSVYFKEQLFAVTQKL